MESHKDIVYENLKYKIIMRKLEPGTTLNEKKLMEEHGIGRTPLREIMIRLQHEGLIQRFPRSGTIVAPMDINELKNINEVRIPLERLVGKVVTQRITVEQISKLKDLLRKAIFIMREGTEEELVSYDTKLHNFLYKITGNNKLMDIIEELQAVGSRYWFSISFSREEYLDQLQQWEQIVSAIEKRAGDQTANLLHNHILKSIESIKTRL